MKTTIELPDPLLTEARRAAAREGLTLRALVEDALRARLRRSKAPFRLRDRSFAGHGLQPGVREGAWEQIRDIVYEGRGA